MSNSYRDFIQLDVRGDGNCFYRALYSAIKYHPYNILEMLFMCLEIPTDLTEDEFVSVIRNKLAIEVTGDLFERMERDTGSSLYETMREAAEMAANNSAQSLWWDSIIESASHQFQEKFNDPYDFLSMSKDDFKGRFAEIINDSGVYASEMDYKLIEYILSKCNVELMSVNPERPRNLTLLGVERNGRPLLLVRRLEDLEHYAFLVPYSVYEDNMGELIDRRKNTEVYSNPTANSVVKPAAKTKNSTRRSTRKPAVKKPVNNKPATARKATQRKPRSAPAAKANKPNKINRANKTKKNNKVNRNSNVNSNLERALALSLTNL